MADTGHDDSGTQVTNEMSSAASVGTPLSLRLARAYLRNIRLTRPASFAESLRMVRLMRAVTPYTMVSVKRLHTLYRLAKEVNLSSVPGDIVQCGVFNGGSAAVMASVGLDPSRDRRIWLFDSFEGLPTPTEKDGSRARSEYYEGFCLGHQTKVEEVFRAVQIPESRVRIVKGWFQETFPSVTVSSIALLHIDADWYESVKLCLEKFFDSVEPGGFIVLDDYGEWEGCQKATDEFIADRCPDLRLIRTDGVAAYLQKPAHTVAEVKS